MLDLLLAPISFNVSKYCVIKTRFMISAAVMPANTTDKTIIWSSSNEKIVTADNGILNGVSAGEAMINVHCQEVNYEINITVLPDYSFLFGSGGIIVSAYIIINILKKNRNKSKIIAF